MTPRQTPLPPRVLDRAGNQAGKRVIVDRDRGRHGVRRLILLALLLPVAAWCSGKVLEKPAMPPVKEGSSQSANIALARGLAALAPQRPGHVDLYVLGVAGDGNEQVFRNEVLHLENLAVRRLDAEGRVLVLANHASAPMQRPLPVASEATLRHTLAHIGGMMDPEEDLLLLYLTSHGTQAHEFLLRRPGLPDQLLTPQRIRAALDDAGIRHRVVVISACYSGGFARALRSPHSLLLMAARHDRSSFGCGNDSVATYFGRAWLVDGLNHTVDFVEAFERARIAIDQRERAAKLPPSRPQIDRGEHIGRRLAAWRAGFAPGPAVPYPHAEREPGPLKAIPPLLPADRPGSR